MSFREQLYRMSLIGSVAGLLAWAIGVWVPVLITLSQENYGRLELIESGLIGFFIGMMCMAFSVHLTARGLSRNPRLLIVAGAVCGGLVGIAAVYLFLCARGRIGLPPWMLTMTEWVMVGASLGAVIGVIKHGPLWLHVLLSAGGGAVGALAGGGALVLLGESIPYVSSGFGLVMMGTGISFCSTMAVNLMGRGVVKLEVEAAACPEPVGEFFTGKQQEWDILKGDSILFGRANNDANSKRFVHVPDETMADLHAYVLESEGEFVLRPHSDDMMPGDDGKLVAYALSVKRLRDKVWVDMNAIEGDVELESEDLIKMGETTFRFRVRGKSRRPQRAAVALICCLVFFALARTSFGQTPQQAAPQLVLADKMRLLQCWPGSERPCFRLSLNVVGPDGNPTRIPFYDPRRALEQVKIYEDAEPLELFEVGLNAEGETPPQRYAILLVDVSGSMLEPADDVRTKAGVSKAGGFFRPPPRRSSGDVKTKFEVMKAACLSFADSVVDGVDHVAVIPFESRNVVARINQAEFLSEKAKIRAAIEKIEPPKPEANTALYSASVAALARLQMIREQSAAVRNDDLGLLLLAMTDGNNDVGHAGDDKGLLTDWNPVREKSKEVGIQFITIGFGNSDNLDKEVLQMLAWPGVNNYLPARGRSELLAAFETARSFQINRLQLYFFPRQDLRSRLIRSHTYKVRLAVADGYWVEGDFEWEHAAGFAAPPFEGLLREELRPPRPASEREVSIWLLLYLLVVLTSPYLIYVLWVKLPRKIWADDYDGNILRERAMSVLSTTQER